MGCLALLILGFIFRGAILSLLGAVFSAIIGVLAFVLQLGAVGLIVLFVLFLACCAIATATK